MFRYLFQLFCYICLSHCYRGAAAGSLPLQAIFGPTLLSAMVSNSLQLSQSPVQRVSNNIQYVELPRIADGALRFTF